MCALSLQVTDLLPAHSHQIWITGASSTHAPTDRSPLVWLAF